MIHAESVSATLNTLSDDILAGAKRSLGLLRDIDRTIAGLCYDQQHFKSFAEIALKTAESIRKAPCIKILDAEGAIEEKLRRGQEAARQMRACLIAGRDSASEDPDLTEEDGVVEEFDCTIEAVTDLHNAIDELRIVLGEHEADVSTRVEGRVFSTPEEIDGYLSSL